MDNHLRVLMVEDSESDAALIARQLEKANYVVEFERVDTPAQMEAALAERSWDFIFSDYTMPQFDAFAALKLLQETGRDIPFIVISGTIGEETAVEIMRSGAHDYLMKDKLARLIPVVKREIEEAIVRKERRMTERALRESEARLRALIQTARDVVFTITPEGKFTSLNPAFEALTGWPTSDWIGKSFEELLFPEDVAKALDRINKVIAGAPNIITELRIRTKVRGVIQAELIATRHLQNGELIELLGIARDITERKQSELVLKNKDALLSDAMDIARLGPWSFDLSTSTFTFNDPFYSIYRTTAKEVGGYTMSSDEYIRRFVHPDDAAFVALQIRNNLENPNWQQRHRLEHRVIYPDGEIGYIESNMFVIKDEDGHTIKTRGVNQVVTERKKAEEELRQSEERYRALFETNPVPMLLYDPTSLTVLASNQAAVDLYGYARQELTSMKITDIYSPEDVAGLREYLSENDISPRHSGVWRHRKKDGSIILVDSTSQNFSHGGKIARLALLVNVTEKLQSEEELRKLSRAVEQSPASIIITDTKGNIEYVNSKFTALSGYTIEEIRGKNARVLKTEGTPQEEYKNLWETIAAGKEWRGEFHSKRKSGEYYWELASISPITDHKGTITHYLSVQEDVTGRKESEKALRESEERYRQFFEDDLTGDFISTVDGRILSCNPAFARIYGFESVEEVLRTNADSLYPARDDRENFLKLLREKRKLEYHEEVATRRDGKTIYLVSNEIGIFNERDELVQIKGYIFDDTERRLLEEQLRQSQKMESIGTLAGGIAHDFNNILNNILGFVMQLKKYSLDPVKVMKYSETIEKSASRGAELSAHLLSVSRRKKREETEFDVGALLNEITNLCSETFPRSVTITKILEDNLLPVKGDRGSLYQVMLNLTVNARDAMPNGGTLTIEARNRRVGQEVNSRLFPTNSSRCIEIKVSDTGSGMSEAVREKIFDPFFTTKEQGKGTGLGLSIVYNIVKEHRGSIIVESEEGAGSAFTVYLPAVEPPIVHKSPSDTDAATSHGELVLLVDDEEMMQELGKELLEDNGFKVLIAKDGVEAVEFYRERGKEISLVILDLVMPRMDGGQTYMELKKLNNNVKAFFCSGFTSDKVITQLLEEEHLQAIKKPFHPTDFINMVQATLHGG